MVEYSKFVEKTGYVLPYINSLLMMLIGYHTFRYGETIPADSNSLIIMLFGVLFIILGLCVIIIITEIHCYIPEPTENDKQ